MVHARKCPTTLCTACKALAAHHISLALDRGKRTSGIGTTVSESQSIRILPLGLQGISVLRED
jgi:hypothetical protein